MTTKALHKQVITDINTNLTKAICYEITTLQTKLTDQIANLSANIKKDFNAQIAEVIWTIHALNQYYFTKVVECLPNNPNTMSAHLPTRNPKSWAMPINEYMSNFQTIPTMGCL